MTVDQRLHHRPGDSTQAEGSEKLSPAPLATGTRLGDYQITRVLAQTDNGFTYAANDGAALVQEFFPHQFALRDYDGISLLLCAETFNTDYEQGLSEFLLLARVLSQIDHPGRVVHYQEQNDTAWYAVELKPRASLADLLKTRQRLPEASLKTMLYSALTYLDAAHDAGALHLELTPKRILLSDEDKLVICGFNTDKLHYPQADESEAADYRAPELTSFRGQLGRWTDFYALGAICYQGIARSTPPSADTRLQASDQGIDDPLIPAIEAGKGYFSRDFLQIIDRLLVLNPADRPQSAAQIVEWLDPATASPGVTDSNTTDNSAAATDTKSAGQKMPAARPGTTPAAKTNGAANATDLPLVKATSKTLRSATTIALAALTRNSKPAAPAPGSTTQHPPASTDPATAAKQRREPVFAHADEAREHTQLSLDNSQANPAVPLGIADDLESAAKALATPSDDELVIRPVVGGKTQRSSSTGGSPEITARIKHPPGLVSPRLIIGIVIVIAALLAVYLLLRPVNEEAAPAQRSAIEIIGSTVTPATSVIGSQPPASSDGLTGDTPVSLTQADDPAQISDYRKQQEITTLIEPHLTSAQAHLAAGRLFTPEHSSAYREFTAVLDLDPENQAAAAGIETIATQTLARVESLTQQGAFAKARERLAAASVITQAADRLARAGLQIDLAEQRLQEETARQLAARQAQQEEQARQDRERRQQLEQLLASALKAFEDGRLIEPQNDNALALYRAALDLDPNNQRAGNGIGNITVHFLRSARSELADGQLNLADQSLRSASAIEPDNSAVVQLRQQLDRRIYLTREKERLQAEADARIAQAQAMAAEQDQMNLASGITAYYDGNYPEAYRFLYPLAQRKEPRAQVRVARMLHEARGVERDSIQAVALFSAALNPVQLAASQGNAWAQSDLGDYFVDGLVIDTDYQSAAFWYHKAAEQGYAPAQTNLGWLYMAGHGVPPDRKVAVQWFRKAANQGNMTALNNLRELGEDQPKNGS